MSLAVYAADPRGVVAQLLDVVPAYDTGLLPHILGLVNLMFCLRFLVLSMLSCRRNKVTADAEVQTELCSWSMTWLAPGGSVAYTSESCHYLKGKRVECRRLCLICERAH
jgi:hypothetical protein